MAFWNRNSAQKKDNKVYIGEPLSKPDISKNNYSDSVAAELGKMPNAKQVSVDGRKVGGREFQPDQIEKIYQGYIYGAMRKISAKVADIIVNHSIVVDETGEIVDDATLPYQQAARNARASDGSIMDEMLFWQGVAMYYILQGEAFVFKGEVALIGGKYKEVENFTLLQSDSTIRQYNVGSDTQEVVNYQETVYYPNATPQKNDYYPGNIVVVKDLNPFDLKVGYGMIRPIMDQIIIENSASRLQMATIMNTIKAPGILSPDGDRPMSNDDYDNLVSAVEQRFTSDDLDKAGIPIISGGGKLIWEEIATDWDKLAMEKIRNMNRQSMFAALSVSMTTLGIEQSGVTRDTSRTMTDNFVIDTCMPIVYAILNAFNADYHQNYPNDKYKNQYWSADAPVSKDLDAEKAEADITKVKADTFKVLVDVKVDPQYAAELVGLVPPDEDIEMVESSETPDQLKPFTGELDDTSTDDDTDAGDDASTDGSDDTNADDTNTDATKNTSPKVKGRVKKPTAPKLHIHSRAEKRRAANVYTNQVNKLIAKNITLKEKTKVAQATEKLGAEILNADTKLVTQAIEKVKLTPDQNAAQPADTNDDDYREYIEQLTEALLTFYVVMIPIYGKQRAADLAASLQVDAGDMVITESAKQDLRNRLMKVANSHFSTISGELANIIQNGRNIGLSNDAIIAQINTMLKSDIAGWQLDSIVDTEVANAIRQSVFYADFQVLTNNGLIGVAYKVWRTNPASPKICEFCKVTEGTEVPFSENFFNIGDSVVAQRNLEDGTIRTMVQPVNFVDINAGGLHPHCYCGYALIVNGVEVAVRWP